MLEPKSAWLGRKQASAGAAQQEGYHDKRQRLQQQAASTEVPVWSRFRFRSQFPPVGRGVTLARTHGQLVSRRRAVQQRRRRVRPQAQLRGYLYASENPNAVQYLLHQMQLGKGGGVGGRDLVDEKPQGQPKQKDEKRVNQQLTVEGWYYEQDGGR